MRVVKVVVAVGPSLRRAVRCPPLILRSTRLRQSSRLGGPLTVRRFRGPGWGRGSRAACRIESAESFRRWGILWRIDRCNESRVETLNLQGQGKVFRHPSRDGSSPGTPAIDCRGFNLHAASEVSITPAKGRDRILEGLYFHSVPMFSVRWSQRTGTAESAQPCTVHDALLSADKACILHITHYAPLRQESCPQDGPKRPFRALLRLLKKPASSGQ